MKKKCENCGTEIIDKARQKPKRFCSEECRHKYWSSHRKELKRKAVYLLICEECGDVFESYGNKNRKYCDPVCYVEARFGKGKKEKKDRHFFDESITLRNVERVGEPKSNWKAETMELHRDGYGSKEISERLNLPYKKVRNWIENHREERGGYWEAKSADEWKEVLREEMNLCIGEEKKKKKSKSYQVHLVSGNRNGGKSADSLGMIVEEVLKMDTYNGDIYAFCNMGGTTITYIRWDGSGLQMTRRRRESGRYKWPSVKLGESSPPRGYVTVKAEEFEYLLCGGEG